MENELSKIPDTKPDKKQATQLQPNLLTENQGH